MKKKYIIIYKGKNKEKLNINRIKNEEHEST